MSIQDRFFEYADAFERVYLSNNWNELIQFFTENACYDSGDGSADAVGRSAVLAKLEASVDKLDRIMDSRTLSLTSPCVIGSTVSVVWRAKYSKLGSPDLLLEGAEFARFEGNQITELRDELSPGTLKSVSEWIARNGQKSSS